ncbi:MAG: respiratory nitrate reductase subunit gamma [Gammaproteobacteria bacterium]|nr:respiratory nitrate reductase subunit gamma [Gammaproteobacteria bacterium]
MNTLNNFLFIALPYIAIVVFLVGNIYRYVSTQFTYSSLSAQFLEDKQGFWGTVPFHIGILMLFLGHLAIFLFPEATLAWNSNPVRLIIHEGIAFTFGLTVLIALIGLMLRRLFNKRLRVVTSKMDIVIELLLLTQVILGCWIALGYRWGTSWFAADLTPYLWSIFQFDPQIQAVSALPLVIKLHIVGAFVIVLIFPFTRLVHFLVAPIHYLWRPYQVVIWYWDKQKIRKSSTAWTSHRPQNN